MKTKTCIVCKDDFDTKYHHQKLCGKKECSRVHYLEKERKNYKKRPKKIKIYETGRCVVCKKEFEKKDAKFVTCGDPACVKTNRADVSANWHKIYSQPEQVVIDTKCPGCGKMHKKRINRVDVSTGTNRYYCAGFPMCMQAGRNFYPEQFESVWEISGRAMI